MASYDRLQRPRVECLVGGYYPVDTPGLSGVDAADHGSQQQVIRYSTDETKATGVVEWKRA